MLRGFLGLVSNQDPEYKLPSQIVYLEEQATVDGLDIVEFFVDVVCKSLCSGKTSILVDVREDGTIYFTAYPARSNINWNVEFIKGEQVLTRAVYQERVLKTEGEEVDGYKEYLLAADPEDTSENPIPYYTVNTYDDDGVVVDSTIPELTGKRLEIIPIINIGSVKNTIEPDVIPLLGLSDIALTIYRENADLHQSHFMTCHPTLIFFGVDADEMPGVVGSGLAVGISDPSARAEYPATDTSALEHIRSYINDLMAEAIQKGAKFLADRKSAESAEALKRRETSQSTDLVHIVTLAGKGVEAALNMAMFWMGSSESAEFEASTEFGRLTYSSQEIQAIVAAWLQGAISHDTVLDRLRDSGLVDEDVTNKQEKKKIESEAPSCLL